AVTSTAMADRIGPASAVLAQEEVRALGHELVPPVGDRLTAELPDVPPRAEPVGVVEEHEPAADEQAGGVLEVPPRLGGPVVAVDEDEAEGPTEHGAPAEHVRHLVAAVPRGEERIRAQLDRVRQPRARPEPEILLVLPPDVESELRELDLRSRDAR